MCTYIVFISYLPPSPVCGGGTQCKQDEFEGVNRIESMSVHHTKNQHSKKHYVNKESQELRQTSVRWLGCR